MFALNSKLHAIISYKYGLCFNGILFSDEISVLIWISGVDSSKGAQNNLPNTYKTTRTATSVTYK